ncbi:hypothetical protein BGX20_007158 [Mortierella sp. AD010]|nr:hypothetical protein BGX20_007158 [Mortierella sp. AD010]
MTDDLIKNDIARNLHIIQDLIGVYPKYMKIPDPRLLGIPSSMGYTLVGFYLDELRPQMSTVIAGYYVPSTGAAVALTKIINTINAHGYDVVCLDGCTNDKTPYKKDPIENNGYVGDAHANDACSDNLPGGKSGVLMPEAGKETGKNANGNGGELKKSGVSKLAITSVLTVIKPTAIYSFFPKHRYTKKHTTVLAVWRPIL